jgi:hypothetical protein
MGKAVSSLWSAVLFPVRILRALSRTVLALLLVASLALTVATLTISGVYAVASAALSAVGLSSVAAREAAQASTDALKKSERETKTREARKKVTHETTSNVTRRVKKGALRNISSVAGEAIPFVGIAVIAGALAADVKDACDTAKDMAGLQAALDDETDPESARQKAIEAFDCTELIPNYDDLPEKEDLWKSVKNAPRAAWETASSHYYQLRKIDWSERIEEVGGDAVDWINSWFSYQVLQQWWKGDVETVDQ